MTLIDSKQDIAASIAYSLQKSDLGKIETEQVYPYIGRGLITCFENLVPGADQSVLDNLIKIYKEHFAGHCAVNTSPYPKVIETLTELRGKGILTVRFWG